MGLSGTDTVQRISPTRNAKGPAQASIQCAQRRGGPEPLWGKTDARSQPPELIDKLATPIGPSRKHIHSGPVVEQGSTEEQQMRAHSAKPEFGSANDDPRTVAP